MNPKGFSHESFEFLEMRRSGGMATVRQARLKDTGALCALKYARQESQEGLASLSMNRELEALSELEHENIVRLLGLGTDGAERFIVLEWLEETLSDRIRALGPSDWNNFYEHVGRPLLDALRYAHMRGVAHRDLKPSNVMFNDQMVPKITDFGIARDLESAQIGRTFAAAGSHPWTPAERDDGMFSERRDLYSWAALCIASLTARLDFKSTADIRSVILKLQTVVPSELLLRCLSDIPAERPNSATGLLWDLDDFHQARMKSGDIERLIAVEMTPGAHKKLSELIPSESLTSRRVIAIFSDISEGCDVIRLPEGDLEFTSKHFRVRAGRNSSQTPWLLIKDVGIALAPIRVSASVLIRFVERHSDVNDLNLLRRNLVFLEAIIDSAQEREQEAQRERDEERYLVMQQEVLAARMRALRDLPALRYRNGRWVAAEFSVELDEDELLPPKVGEQRIIRARGGIFVFAVSKVAVDRVSLAPVGAKRGVIPPSGRLQVDTVAQRRALERQEDAVKAVRNGQAVFPGLKRLLVNPQQAQSPEGGGRESPQHLSEDKRAVLDAALGVREIMLVRGPPGTGKTTLISEVVKRFLAENTGARVLVTAQTHIAIDHVIMKLLDVPELADRVVRVARPDEEKIALGVKPALLHNRVIKWCEDTAKAARSFSNQRAAIVGLKAQDVELSVRLEMLILASERLRLLEAVVAQGEGELVTAQSEVSDSKGRDLGRVESATMATMSLAERIHERKRVAEHVLRLKRELTELGDDGKMVSDLADVDMRDWLAVLEEHNHAWVPFRKELEVQVAWLDLLGQLKRFETVVLRAASVVAGTCVGLGSIESFLESRFDLCIIDEASKATATEALIPMARSSRCLLVGDPKQLPPFDYGSCEVEGYGEEEIKETMLDYLLVRLPPSCVFQLTHQHRMCKGIGDLISEVFYDDDLINTRPDADRPEWLRRRFPKPVVWVNVQGSSQRKQGHTYVNPGEQDVILRYLTLLDRSAGRMDAKVSVAVIAGYAAQAHALDSRIQKDTFTSIDVEVATVDSFQGRESDVCIFSVTLSNSNDFLGFLRSVKRLNVAFSRAKDLLLIVGDQRFCYEVPGANPFKGLIDYLEAHRPTCETRDVRE